MMKTHTRSSGGGHKKRPGRPSLDPGDPSVQTCLVLPSKLYDALDKRARDEEVSLAEIIRRDLRKRTPKKNL
jgi:hypothetical protein